MCIDNKNHLQGLSNQNADPAELHNMIAKVFSDISIRLVRLVPVCVALKIFEIQALQQQLLPRWVCFMFQNGEVLSEERFNIISMKATVDFEVDKFLKDQKAEVACQICKSTGKVATYRGKTTVLFRSPVTYSDL